MLCIAIIIMHLALNTLRTPHSSSQSLVLSPRAELLSHLRNMPTETSRAELIIQWPGPPNSTLPPPVAGFMFWQLHGLPYPLQRVSVPNLKGVWRTTTGFHSKGTVQLLRPREPWPCAGHHGEGHDETLSPKSSSLRVCAHCDTGGHGIHCMVGEIC